MTHVDAHGRIYDLEQMRDSHIYNAAASLWRWLLRHHAEHTPAYVDTARRYSAMLDEIDRRGVYARAFYERMHMPPSRDTYVERRRKH